MRIYFSRRVPLCTPSGSRKALDNIAETSCRIITSAQETGIGLTHLPVFLYAK